MSKNILLKSISTIDEKYLADYEEFKEARNKEVTTNSNVKVLFMKSFASLCAVAVIVGIIIIVNPSINNEIINNKTTDNISTMTDTGDTQNVPAQESVFDKTESTATFEKEKKASNDDEIMIINDSARALVKEEALEQEDTSGEVADEE